jgi:hypothetical protein
MANLWHTCPKWQERRFSWHAAFIALHSFRQTLLYYEVYICKRLEIVCDYCCYQMMLGVNNFVYKLEAVICLNRLRKIAFKYFVLSPSNNFAIK